MWNGWRLGMEVVSEGTWTAEKWIRLAVRVLAPRRVKLVNSYCIIMII